MSKNKRVIGSCCVFLIGVIVAITIYFKESGDAEGVANSLEIKGGKNNVKTSTPETSKAPSISEASHVEIKAKHWGPIDIEGLQLGAWLGKRKLRIWSLSGEGYVEGNPPIVCGVIQNTSARPIKYSDYFLGYFEAVVVRARLKGNSKWQFISRRKGLAKYYKSAGASPKNVHVLQEHERMPAITVPAIENSRVKMNDLEHTFLIDLYDFEWPESWSGTIEIMVSQKLGKDGSKDTWSGVLNSAAFELSMQSLRAKASEERE